MGQLPDLVLCSNKGARIGTIRRDDLYGCRRGFFIVAISFLLYTGRCVDGLYEAYMDVEVPQETIVEVEDE